VLYPLAAELVRRYGDTLLDVGEDFGDKLLDKGADAVAASAVGALIGWLKARAGKHKATELVDRAQAAIAAPSDRAALDKLAASIADVTGDASAELEALVRVAERAAAVTVTNIRFGAVKSGVYVEGGGNAQITRLDVEIN
jgi:hypothetical protein